MGLTLQACDKGCLKCNAKNECIFCDTSNNYYLSGVNCAVSTLTNCLLLNSNGECGQCAANYYLDVSTKKCVAVETLKQVANCSYYGSAQVCIKCAKNFFIKDSKCTAVVKLVDNCETYSDDGKCVGCASGFIFNAARDGCVAIPSVSGCSAYSFLDCKTCSTGFLQNPNLYFVDYQTSSASIYAEVRRFIAGTSNDWTALYRCQKYQDANCLTASAFNVCTTCKAAYFLTADKACRAYPKPIIEACLTYNSLITCSSCLSGYYLESSVKCTLIAGDKLITDCVTYDNKAANVQCTLCSAAKYLSANTCSSARADSINITNCKTNTITSDSCAACNDSFVLTTDFKKCLANIPNCAEYNTSSSTTTVLTCKTCNSTFYLNTVDSVTTCVPGGIEGCISYSSSTVCIACNVAEYYLKDAKCTKHVKADNCLTYSGANFNECATCAAGFYPFKYSTTCSAITVVASCATYNDDATCATCVADFFLLNSKCVSISNTYTGCKAANKDAVSCTTCMDGKALKTVDTVKTCVDNHNYIVDYCDTVGSGISFKINTDPDTDSCLVCKEGSFPFNLAGFFSCINNDHLTTRGVTVAAAVAGCRKYSNAATPVCQQCSKFLAIGAARSCVDTCSDDNTQLLDNLAGDINTCVSNAAAGLVTAYAITDCIVATKGKLDTDAAAAAASLHCIKFKSTLRPTVTLSTSVNLGDGPTLHKDLLASSIVRPDDAFLYNGFPITGVAPAALDKHTPADNASKDCELWYSDTNLYCARCKFGYSVLLDGTTKTTCVKIDDCDITVSYSGFSSSINRFLSCHKCKTATNFVTLSLTATGDAADTYFITRLTDAKLAVRCIAGTAVAADATIDLPLLVANCLVYGWNTVAAGTATANGKGCIACKPGFRFGDFSKPFTADCVEITGCDLTKGSMANRCSGCTQVNGAVAQYKALENYKAQLCRIVKTDNCLFSDATEVSGFYKCRVCKPGFWLNHDNYCEKIDLPQCKDNINTPAFPTTLYKLPDSTDVAATAEYYAVKHLSKANSITGCDYCATGFTGFRMVTGEKQCVVSPYVASNVFVADPLKYVTDCSKYLNNLDTANSPVATCSLCKNNKIPTDDGKKCVASISNCTTAQKDAITKCKTCAITHVQIAGACLLKNIAGCATYDASATELACSACNDGFVLAANKKACTAGKVIGCKVYDVDLAWSCTTCLDGYTRITTTNSRSYCFKINDGSNCKVLDGSATGLQGNLYKCTTCNANNSAAYLPKAFATTDVTKSQSLCLSLNLVDKCITYLTSSSTVGTNSYLCTACSTGFWVDEDKNVCVARVNQPSGCTEYEKNKDKCKVCSTSTFINETATDCVSFPNGILRCATYSNDTVCTSCNVPSYLNANACPLSTVISKCAGYSGNYTCTGCESGYFLTNSTFCEIAKAANCYTYTSINACEKCSLADTNKGLKTDTNGITNCVDKNVANCDISTNEFPFKCTTCKKGFFLATDGTCAAATAINKCLLYDTATTCILCEALSVLAVDRKSCVETAFSAYNDANCVDSQVLGTPACSKCTPGSVFVNNVCTSCSNNTYTDGCFSCDPANQATCFSCRPGYYQTQAGKCVAISTIINNNGTTSSAMINTLFGLFALLAALLF